MSAAVAPAASSASASADKPFLALGIISAPEYIERRLSMRTSWMQLPNVGPNKPVSAQFVVRSRGAPPWLSALLKSEQATHGDMLPMASIAWNETRARGPVLSVAAWLAHAAAAFPRATLVGKVDDDAYIHTVELEALLRGVVSQLAPQVDRLYLGSMSWFHWFPKIFERSGFGWTFSNAWGYGDGCRNATSAAIRCGSHQRIGSSDDCGTCTGPFPFMSGYLMLFSTALAAELAASEAMRSDVARLKAMPKFMSRGGGPSNKVMEDIWLGSLLHRAPPARPLTYVALEEYLTGVFVSDGWGLKVRDGTPPSCAPQPSHHPNLDRWRRPRCSCTSRASRLSDSSPRTSFSPTRARRRRSGAAHRSRR